MLRLLVPICLTACASAAIPTVSAASCTSPVGRVIPRTQAPDFTANSVVDGKFDTFTLSNYLGKVSCLPGTLRRPHPFSSRTYISAHALAVLSCLSLACAPQWMVLFFYPFDFTFVCPTEITSFSDSIDEFRAINAEIAGVSTDSHHTHLAWINTAREDGGVGELKIPLVADISKEISHKYGVLVENPEDEMYGAALVRLPLYISLYLSCSRIFLSLSLSVCQRGVVSA